MTGRFDARGKSGQDIGKGERLCGKDSLAGEWAQISVATQRVLLKVIILRRPSARIAF